MIKNSFVETIKVLDGEVYNLEYHQKRYESVLHSQGATQYKQLADYIYPPKLGLYRCRLVYTQETIHVEYSPYKKKEIHALKILHNDSIDYAQKSTQRQALDEMYAKREQADDILIVKDGFLSDTSIANIALYKEGAWYTPMHPLLQGTTRQRYVDDGILVPQEIELKDLQTYTKIALLNAMIDFDIIRDVSYIY